MKLAYVASPLRADTPAEMARNREHAAIYCSVVADFRDSAGNYFVPISPVLNFAAFDYSDPKQRQTALNMRLAILERCDVLVAAGAYISEGMRGEMQAAARMGLPIMGYGISKEEIRAVTQDLKPLLSKEHTTDGVEDYTEQLLVIKADAMRKCYQTSENQLVYCICGGGALPNPLSGSLSTSNIMTGENEVWTRSDVCGVADADKLPDWAREAWGAFKRSYEIDDEEADDERESDDFESDALQGQGGCGPSGVDGEHGADPEQSGYGLSDADDGHGTNPGRDDGRAGEATDDGGHATEYRPDDEHVGDCDEESEYDEGNEIGDDDDD